MRKTVKLNLQELVVQSFVTTIPNKNKITINGGATNTAFMYGAMNLVSESVFGVGVNFSTFNTGGAGNTSI
ncbi:MAG: pinensin family lanthipeptide [Bacteroidetes bacterium]|nr:pinensin family lanthipeptide [Bacteroidota bacterium]